MSRSRSLVSSKGWHWWVFLGLSSFLLSPPYYCHQKSQPCFIVKQKEMFIAFLFPGQLYPLLSTKRQSLALHQLANGVTVCKLESPGTRQHELKVPTEFTASAAGWQMLKRLPKVTAAQVPSHTHFISTDQCFRRSPTFPWATTHLYLFSLLPAEQARQKQTQKPSVKPSGSVVLKPLCPGKASSRLCDESTWGWDSCKHCRCGRGGRQELC